SFSGAADVQAPAGPLKRPSDRAEVRRVTRASRLFFGLVGAAVVVYFFLPVGEQTILYDLIALSAGGAMLAGVRRYRPDPLPAWTLLGLGTLCYAGGDIVFGDSSPVPSTADMLYLSAYLLLALGIMGI